MRLLPREDVAWRLALAALWALLGGLYGMLIALVVALVMGQL